MDAGYDALGVGQVDGSGEFEVRSLGIKDVYKHDVNRSGLATLFGGCTHWEEPKLNSVGGEIHGVDATSKARTDAVLSALLNDATGVAGNVEVNTVAVGALRLYATVRKGRRVGQHTTVYFGRVSHDGSSWKTQRTNPERVWRLYRF